MNLDHLKKEYLEKGFCHFKLLSDQESEKYSKLVNKRFEDSAANNNKIKTGLNNYPELWNLINKRELIEIIEYILKKKIFYLYHSTIMQTNNDNHYQYHRDNPCRKFGVGPDWDTKEKFNIMRVGIYLDKFEETNFRLNLIPNSHKKKISWREIFRFFHRKLVKNGFQNKITHFIPKIIGEEIKVNQGTCILFDPRVYHSPSPHVGTRRAAFLAFGDASFHSDNYVNYFTNLRKDDHDGIDVGTLVKQTEFLNYLKENNIFYPIRNDNKKIEGAFIN